MTQQQDTTEKKDRYPDFKVPHNVMLEALMMSVFGFKRMEIVNRLIAQKPKPEWLKPIQHLDRRTIKNLLSQRLRQVDIQSSKYAYTKYEAAERNFRAAYYQKLNAEVENIVNHFIQDAIQNDPKIRKTIRKLKKQIINAVKKGLIHVNVKIPTHKTHQK